MTEETLPPPESCCHNLRREAESSGRAEPTDFCQNDIGVFHMLDCPLFVGRACTYFEAAPAESPAISDAELEELGWVLRRDFLSWHYARRVRALRLPVGALGEPLTVEQIPEPEENGEIALKQPIGEPVVVAAEEPGDAAVAATAVAATAVEGDTPEPEPVAAPTGPSRPEMYPGQRRSEERVSGRRKRAETVAEPDPASADSDAAEQRPEPPQKKTVEELFEGLPEAPLPTGDAKPRRRGRRRRGAKSGPPARAASGAPGGERSSGSGAPSEPRRRGRRSRRRNAPSGGAAGGGPKPEGRSGGSGSRPAPGGDGGAAPGPESGSGSGRRRSRRRRGRGGPPAGGETSS